jgi:formamidopyrimidine-DNA glycosylase
MPELPEVETTRRGIEPYAKGQRIEKVIVREKRLRWPVDENLSAQLSGRQITSVERRAKYLLLATDIGEVMIHLGMSGSLRIIEQEKPKKHDHLDLVLCNGKTIRFNDPRRFGSVLLAPAGQQHKLLASLGVEPLLDEFNIDYLWPLAKQRKLPIKAFIMNNQVVVGVGNIYAQEALFLTGIHPGRAANRISKKRLESLIEAIKQVLAKAIEAGGSSLKDFTGADGKPGYFQQTLNVYGRQGEACVVCSNPLKQLTIGQRNTAFCSHCQR